jgi:hypothetical protein
VPTLEQRRFVRDLVLAFMGRYPENRYLVTCRTLSYQPPPEGQPDLRLPQEVPSLNWPPSMKRALTASSSPGIAN